MIEGVIIKNLVTHTDERGFFREIFRFTNEFKNITIGQISHSLVYERVIKGWHGHNQQSQWNYVVTGEIKVVLSDNRKESKTFGKIMEFIIGEGDGSKAYFFPPGVLHGYKCIIGPMNIIYVTSGCYDLSDEVRIPLEDFCINYNW